MAKTVLGAPSALTPDEVVGPTGTPSTSAPASSQWVADVADKALSKDDDVVADVDTATPTDTNKVPNAADVKEKLDEKLDAKLDSAASKVLVTDADGNIIVSDDVSLDKLKAVEALTTDGALVSVDADGKLAETTFTKAKAEALEALATDGAAVAVDADGKLAEVELTKTQMEALGAITSGDLNLLVTVDDNGLLTPSGLEYDPTNYRLSQGNAPGELADADTDVLTYSDGVALFQPIGTALEGITLPDRGVHTLEPDQDEDTKIFEFETLAPLTGETPTTVAVYATTGSNQVEFYLSSRVPYYAKFQGTRAVTTRSNGEVTGSNGTVVYAAARRWVSAEEGHDTAQTLTTDAFDREDCVSLIMQFGKGGGSTHNFTCACQIELTPVDSGQMNLTVTPLSGKQQS